MEFDKVAIRKTRCPGCGGYHLRLTLDVADDKTVDDIMGFITMQATFGGVARVQVEVMDTNEEENLDPDETRH